MGEIRPPKIEPQFDTVRRGGGDLPQSTPDVSIQPAPPQTNVVIKPGVKTSEFYQPSVILVIVSMILPAINSKFHLALEATDVTNAVIQIVGAVGAIISAVAYIAGRAKVKSAAIKAASNQTV